MLDIIVVVMDVVYKRIKDLREDHDLTQRELSEMLHISRSTYSAYENGVNAIPIEILIQLAQIYHTSVDYLLEQAE